MPRPDDATIRKWRELAEEGYLYAEIQRMYPEYSVDQVRHYCLGHTGRNAGGPIQRVDRWYGSNVWLRGSNSPHAQITEKQALRVLNDWDEKRDRWKKSGAEWARILGVSPSTIYMLRRGETWKHLNHPNQGRKPKKKGKAASAKKTASARKKTASARKKTASAKKKAASRKKTAAAKKKSTTSKRTRAGKKK